MEQIPKIFGWVLLISGIAIIGWTLYSSYNIFTGKAPVPEVFTIETKETQVPTTIKEKIPSGLPDIQKEVEKMLGEQLKGFLPTETVPKILNLFIWSMLAWFLVFAGSQIAGLGIKLIKGR